MAEHAILPPSSAEQWGHCGAWYQATYGIPNPDTPQTVFGTASHWVFSESWSKDTSPASYLGHTAPNGYIVDERAIEAAEVMLDACLDTVSKLEKLGADDLVIYCEFRLHMPRVHGEVWGTTDFGYYSAKLRLMGVTDFKTGHTPHEAEGHPQIILYAEGIAQQHGLNGIDDQSIRLKLEIVQPFAYSGEKVSTWFGRLSDLRGDLNRLARKAEENLGTNPTMSSGRWCANCLAVGKCGAARAAGYNAINVVNIDMILDDMNAQDMRREYELISDNLKLIEARKDALKAELEHLVRGGDMSSGYVLDTGKPGALKWSVPIEAAVALAQQFGVDNSVKGVLTPAQTVKKVPAELRPAFETILKEFTHAPSGSLKLVPAAKTMSARAFKKWS